MSSGTVIHFEESDSVMASGFISAYMHKDKADYVQLGEGKQGYFKLPKGILSEMHVKNLIVDKASTFIASRMRPGANWGSGINYLELGIGVGTGTTQNPQAEMVTQQQLRQSLLRKEITAWTYLDANGATLTPTNAIQLTTVFEDTEAVGAIVEMGLFGGDATATKGTGHMFNYKTFPVWNKASGMHLTVTWKLTF